MTENKIYDVFVYCSGKSGSSTLEKTFKKLNHDVLRSHGINDFLKNKKNNYEEYGENVNVFDIIEESRKNKEKIYIIDCFRYPIERILSEFFHHIDHDRKYLPEYKDYTIEELINFFNEKYLYRIPITNAMNDILKHYKLSQFKQKKEGERYLLKTHENIVFIKLFFENISRWDSILSEIFNKQITIHKHNMTNKKPYYDVYKKFLEEYKVPNKYYLNILENDKNLMIFVTNEERKKYLEHWKNRIIEENTETTQE